MAYTFFRVVIRLLSLYIIALVIASVYQAISPMSAHNRGEIVDYGAEYIQDGFKDLQASRQISTISSKRCININAAVFTGVFIAFALCSTIVVLGESLSLVVWLGYLPVKLSMGLVWMVEKLVGGIEKVLSGKEWDSKPMVPFPRCPNPLSSLPGPRMRKVLSFREHGEPSVGNGLNTTKFL